MASHRPPSAVPSTGSDGSSQGDFHIVVGEHRGAGEGGPPPPPPPSQPRPAGAMQRPKLELPDVIPKPGTRPKNALKAVKVYSTDQKGPPDLAPPKHFRPASDFARDADVKTLETPRPVTQGDREDLEATEEREQLERERAKVSYTGSLTRHELEMESIDVQGRVHKGKPPPPGKPPRQFRPTIR
mmetsp:Transcript_6194/g.15661  ORF Transcript_6194/g.15661 Transcript_6194/m.15661 type:complete len:185 (+) Transcript_6194:59-613(+)